MAIEQESVAVEPRALGAADDAARIKASLDQAEREVARMAPSATEQRLKQMLAVFRRTVASWDVTPPSARQIAFLSRLVEDALREATTK